MKLTDQNLSDIYHLNKAGYTDAAISRKLDRNYGTIRYHRQKVGLALNSGSPSDRRTRKYRVYNAQTAEFIAEGTAKECATALGVSLHYFYQLACDYRQGRPRKWAVHCTRCIDNSIDPD